MWDYEVSPETLALKERRRNVDQAVEDLEAALAKPIRRRKTRRLLRRVLAELKKRKAGR